ncbi:MAG TPA: hypothetical protein VGR23_02580, partial [Candidatus Dormibacteraeota bacterium]|nr:hypothetical protein [Candidatus Dormibacteraeota bacterium]
MATIVEEPSESSGPKRRRRRTRRDAREATENGQNGQNGGLQEAQAATATVIEPKPQPLPAPPPPPQVDEYRDLLGQAVGLRLDAVSREFGGRDEMHVTALRNVTLDVGPGEFVAIV